MGPFILDCDLRWKYEDTLKHQSASAKAERLNDSWFTRSKFLDAFWWPHKLPCVWAEQCDNHNNLYWSSYWAFKESSMLFFHTQFTVLASVQAIMSSYSMCIWWLKRLSTISKRLCNALYNWILHRTPHTPETGNEYALLTKSLTIIVYLPVK